MYEYMCNKLISLKEEKSITDEWYRAAYLVREQLMSEWDLAVKQVKQVKSTLATKMTEYKGKM